MVTDSECESALHWLAKSAAHYGRLKAAVVRRHEELKVHLATATLDAEGKTVAEREAKARSSQAYRQAIEAYSNAVGDFETEKALRVAAEARIEIWRTEQANQRRGHV